MTLDGVTSDEMDTPGCLNENKISACKIFLLAEFD